jgi:Na+/melibiose symporter-like transporter
MKQNTLDRPSLLVICITNLVITIAMALLLLPPTAMIAELTRSPFPTQKYVLYWSGFAVAATLISYAIEGRKHRRYNTTRSLKKES